MNELTEINQANLKCCLPSVSQRLALMVDKIIQNSLKAIPSQQNAASSRHPKYYFHIQYKPNQKKKNYFSQGHTASQCQKYLQHFTIKFAYNQVKNVKMIPQYKVFRTIQTIVIASIHTASSIKILKVEK